MQKTLGSFIFGQLVLRLFGVGCKVGSIFFKRQIRYSDTRINERKSLLKRRFLDKLFLNSHKNPDG